MGAAGLLLLTPRLRTRSGPALRPSRLPVTATVLSVCCHVALTALMIAAATWTSPPSKTYVVNLVPAVAAVGQPQGRPSPPRVQPAPPRAPEAPPRKPDPPPRAEEPPPRVTRSAPSELPVRETPRVPAPPAPDLPARPPSLPEPPARTTSLPDRALPPRPAPTLRAGDKERPPTPSAPAPRVPAPPAPQAPTVASRPEPPPPPAPSLGRPSGSAQGSGPVTLDVSDFPFAWYLAAVHRKVTERWEGRALQGRQPVVTFEIGRDGQVSNVTVKESSGNPYYDRTAARAVTEAAPFPRLPDEFPGSVLRVHMGFNFAPDRG